MALDADTEEHLLRDIERKGLPLAQVSLVDICDADPAIFTVALGNLVGQCSNVGGKSRN
jgi:hypothetical protein